MKTKNLQIIISVVLVAALSISPLFCFTALAAVDDITIKVQLIESIKYISISDPATEEEYAEAIRALKLITQTAYDAFTMDHPMRSMWMDINHSLINVAPKGSKTGNHYTWVITELKNTIKPLDAYSSPYAPDYLTETLSAVVNSFTPEGETLYDRVKSIHDYICELTVYTDPKEAPYVYSAYGALVDHRSVCEGYAESFKLICDRNGIECILVSGKGITSSKSENHMWNYVRMDDGKWYAVDATWDDGKSVSSNYLLVGSNTVVNHKNGTVFSENHAASGDISGTNLKIFELPILSDQSYLKNHETVSDTTEITDTTDTDNTLPSTTESKPESSDSISTGSAEERPISSDTAENQKYPQSSEIPESFSFTSSLPSKMSSGSSQDNGAKSYYYNQLNDEQKNFYNALLNIVPPGNRESLATTDSTETTDTLPIQTNTTDTTTDIKTQPPVIDTDNGDDTSDTLPFSEDTAPNNTDNPTLPPDDSSEISDSITVTIVGRPGEDTETGPAVLPPSQISFSDILHVIIIVLALAAMFGFVTIMILKFAHNEKK